MNLSDLREAVRIKTGYPERGATGTTRLNKALNYALRHMWGEMPENLLKSQHRFMLETPISGITKIHFDDRFAWLVPLVGGPALALDGTLNARNFEVQKDGVWYQFRIRDIVLYSEGGEGPMPLVQYFAIIVDKPWSNGTDSNLPFRIYTDGYPYPADVQKIRTIVYNPEVEPRELPVSLHPEEMARMRLGYGWRNQGRIEFAASGDFFQLPAPHYAPVAESVTNEHLWGFDDTLVEHDAAYPGRRYGAAGTFSYIVCHGWGRLPSQYHGVADPLSPDVVGDQPGRLLPFYISSSSKASAQVTTEWGVNAVRITLPDVGYQHAQTNNATFPSYQRSGVEKWIFRARHATQPPVAANHADVKELESDGVYYLWKVVSGDTTVVYDQGQADPVERQFPLKEFHGHFHIRFDKAGDSKVPILMYTVQRPPTLEYETDAAAVPPECFEALTELAASYLTGDRDGALDRKNAYYQSYLNELNRLKRLYTFPGYAQGPFGDALNSRPRGMYIGGPIRSG